MGSDERLFPFLSSANLACGLHAGDPLTMQRAVRMARETGVRVGAHPGFPDLLGFGRRDMTMTEDEVYAATLYQLGALQAFLDAEGMTMGHVKPHGALYLRMTRDEGTADAVTRAVRDFDAQLPLVVLGGPGGTLMQAVADRHEVRAVLEAFPDRAYLSSGHLAPRNMKGALVKDPALAAERAVKMALGEAIAVLDGDETLVEANTLCIHGDNPEAPEIARAVREALESAGVSIRTF